MDVSFRIPMERGVAMGWAQIACVGLLLAAAPGCLPQDRRLGPLPASILDEFSLQRRECPPVYTLITNTNLLAQAGLAQNPDYIIKRADLERVIQMDGAAAFLALYGPGESVRLIH